jgi:membrane associated rhomboid family serine protease
LVKDSARALANDLKVRGSLMGGTLGVLWLVHLVNIVMLGSLTSFGIHPRSVAGLWGILFAPFLHGSVGHLLNNSLAFLWLGLFTMLRRPSDLVKVSVIGGLVAGLGAWLTGGPGTVHIGFSGVIFSFLGFLLTRGWFERSWGSIAVSVLSFFWFGSMIWGVLPTMPGVSWQSHLFGFVGGVIAARVLAEPAPKKAAKKKAKRRR